MEYHEDDRRNEDILVVSNLKVKVLQLVSMGPTQDDACDPKSRIEDCVGDVELKDQDEEPKK